MVKCVECKNCKNFTEGYYWCYQPDSSYELIEECIANDDTMGCDLFVPDLCPSDAENGDQ